jgi:hypothetical protein
MSDLREIRIVILDIDKNPSHVTSNSEPDKIFKSVRGWPLFKIGLSLTVGIYYLLERGGGVHTLH